MYTVLLKALQMKFTQQTQLKFYPVSDFLIELFWIHRLSLSVISDLFTFVISSPRSIFLSPSFRVMETGIIEKGTAALGLTLPFHTTRVG
jgi:hypothetical protein